MRAPRTWFPSSPTTTTIERRDTFDTVAELYDRARPRYPPDLYRDLIALAGLPDGGRILEIGSGTGIATQPLAELGYRIVGVERGPALAAVARAKLAAFANVEIVVSTFETWDLPDEPFDLVFSATAWHWIDPAVGFGKVADALRPGGAFAVMRYDHVAAPDDDGFGLRSQDCYRRFTPDYEPRSAPDAEDLHPPAVGIEASGRFGEPVERSYVTDLTYTSNEYVDLLSTFSNNRQLAEADRRAFLACIRSLIEEAFGGQIRQRLLHRLLVARRAA